MLDFDNLCSREVPSVSAMVYPFSGNHKQKFYWGHKEIMIPGEIQFTWLNSTWTNSEVADYENCVPTLKSCGEYRCTG